MRWHRILNGRITASCEAVDGDAAERILNPRSPSFVISDADWRAMQYRRRLKLYAHKFEQRDPFPILPTRTLHRLDTR